MRYPNCPKEVNDLLDFAREARRFARLYPEEVSAADIIQHLDDFASGWGWDLLDLVLDHEERIADRHDKRGTEIETVDQVTIEHGLAFAEGWFKGDMSDACDETGIMTWPSGDKEQKELHARFHDLTDEICANVFYLIKQQIAEAFVRVANEVLTRERKP